MMLSNPFAITFKDLQASIGEKYKLSMSSVFVYNPTLKPPKDVKVDMDR